MCRVTLFAALALAACKPEVNNTTIPLDLTVDPATIPGESVDRTLWIVGDAATTTMHLDFQIANLPGGPVATRNAWVMIKSGSGAEVQKIIENGPVTSAEVPGNVALVNLMAAAGAVLPDVKITSVTLARSNQAVVPADPAPLVADRFTAAPVNVNQTIDFAFPPAQRFYWFWFRAPATGAYDFAYFGPGRLVIQAANDPQYPLTAAAMEFTVPAAGSMVPFVRVSMVRDEIRRMGVDNGTAGTAGRGRLVVMDMSAPLKLAFPSQAPEHFWLNALGVDHGPRPNPPGSTGTPGSRGPLNGLLDCTDYAGNFGIAPGLSPDGWIGVAGVPPCYRGHEGTDWALRLGPGGQMLQVHSNAAAPGVVFAVDASHFDECTADPFSSFQTRCPNGILITAAPIDNYIAIRQDDGLIAYYVHGATGSARVVPGQKVACGEMLSVVASAGNSLGPHVHFELQDVTGVNFAGTPGFTDMFLVRPPGNSATPIRSAAQWVDPFDPPSRWRSLGPNLAPTKDCR
jgi:hypothetical protein